MLRYASQLMFSDLKISPEARTTVRSNTYAVPVPLAYQVALLKPAEMNVAYFVYNNNSERRYVRIR